MTRHHLQAEVQGDILGRCKPTERAKARASAAVLALVMLTGACSGAMKAGDSTPGPNLRNGESAAKDFCAKVAQAAPTAASYRALAGEAPSDLRSDFDDVASALAALEEIDHDNLPDASAALQDDPAYLDAINRIRRFLSEECGIGNGGEEAAGANSAEEAPSQGQNAGPSTPADESSASISNDPGSSGQGPPAVPEAPGISHAEVKDRMRQIFGDRLWGTNFESSRENVFEFEGNVSELGADEAMSGCAELSLFLAEHPDAVGTTELRLTDFPRRGQFNVLALNQEIRPGDAGRCYTP